MTRPDHELQQEQELLQHFRQHSQGEPSAALDALILDAARRAVAEPAPRPSRAQRLHAWLFGAGSRTRWSVAFASLATLGIGLSLTWRTQEQLPATYDMPAPAAAEAPAAPVLREMAPQLAGEARKQSAEVEQGKAEVMEKKVSAYRSSAGALQPNASFAVSPAAAAAPRAPAPAKPQAAPVEALSDMAVDANSAPVEAQARAQEPAKAKEERQVLNEDQLAETLGHSEVDEAPPLELQLHNILRMRALGLQADADRLLRALRAEHPQLDLDAELKRLQAEMEKPASSP
ncbi:hypothetical protein A9179_07720 [Pseudomonas alcaligenes]|uniref:Anti-sigma factor n=1 Tax=Aquipseudomonas alcaligenes TaxID=43263 RepID=A0ABR7RZD9_AQUAC|nr:hypothetical protein [Pseudomonas alcaligenes]MBC9250159.1 hypothetical protein [Pseudomonas alcaligenes]